MVTACNRNGNETEDPPATQIEDPADPTPTDPDPDDDGGDDEWYFGELELPDEEEEDPGFKMQPSNFLGDLQNANTEYEEFWCNRDESQNPWQHADVQMIRDQKMVEVEAELRR
jgi:hypothetical protein